MNLSNNTQAVSVTLDFSNLYAAGVANVSFKLFDIDFANSFGNTYQDKISSITGTSTTGTTIAPAITSLGSSVALSGSGTNQVLTGTASSVDLGAGSGNGNATITFNATEIRSITFTYGSSSFFANPTYQHIGIDDIDYGVVPETNPSWFCFIGCGSLALWHARRRICRRRLVHVA